MQFVLIGKSVKLSELGTFGFSEVKQNGKVSLQAKFIISPTFAKAYGISTKTGAILQSRFLLQRKIKYLEGVPIVEVNFAAISVQSGIGRDVLISSVKAIIRTLGEVVKSGTKANVDLPYV